MRAVLHEHLDIDPGEAPPMAVDNVSADVADEESAYVTQLAAAFAATSGTPLTSYADVIANVTYGPQIINARRRYRYLELQAFRRHFRDNLPARSTMSTRTCTRPRSIGITRWKRRRFTRG